MANIDRSTVDPESVAPRGVDDDGLFARLAALPDHERHRIASAVADRAAALGLVYLGDAGRRPIAMALPSSSIADADLRARRRLATTMLGAVAKVARHVHGGGLGDDVKEALLAELSPFEVEILRGAPFAPRLATARADLVVDVDGRLQVLEVNTTIPAMQGYSDIAQRAFCEVVLEELGGHSATGASHAVDDLLGARTNSDRLLRALLALDRQQHPRPDPQERRSTLALVHRPGDSQLGELEHLARTFTRRGHDARTVVVDDLVVGVDGQLHAGGFTPDLLYRHIFARRVPPSSAFAALLRQGTAGHVYNPVSAPLEQKGTLALLSELAHDDDRAGAIGLDDAERQAVVDHLPWTRRLVDVDTALPGGARGPLTHWVRGHADQVVLKRSWDFGGKSVVLGDDARDDAGAGGGHRGAVAWPAFVDACLQEGGWVVQQRVRFATARLTLASAGTGDASGTAADHDVFVDASAYATLGIDADAAAAAADDDDIAGCVSRASRSAIVNIQGGGGVLPVVSATLARGLDALLARR